MNTPVLDLSPLSRAVVVDLLAEHAIPSAYDAAIDDTGTLRALAGRTVPPTTLRLILAEHDITVPDPGCALDDIAAVHLPDANRTLVYLQRENRPDAYIGTIIDTENDGASVDLIIECKGYAETEQRLFDDASLTDFLACDIADALVIALDDAIHAATNGETA